MGAKMSLTYIELDKMVADFELTGGRITKNSYKLLRRMVEENYSIGRITQSEFTDLWKRVDAMWQLNKEANND
jgi:hypothetical protein